MRRGWFVIDRDMVNHPIVGIHNPVWFAAWAWMLSEAMWQAKKKRFNKATFTLERGQLLAPLSVASKATNMSIKQFRTFLAALEADGMATKTDRPKGTQKGSGGTVITVCNYDKFQDFELYNSARRAGQWVGKGQARGRQEADDLTPTTPTTPKIGGGSAREPSEIRSAFLAAIGADPITGSMGPDGPILGNMSDMATIERWTNDLGLTMDEQLQTVRDVMVTKRDGPPNSFGYFTKAMQRLAAEKAQPKLEPAEIEGQHDNIHRIDQRKRPGNAGYDQSATGLAAGFYGAISDIPD